IGRNVGAILKGNDPRLSEEWVIVSAHFDHLGMRGTTLYPGADDNASGVAMLLEVARSFAQDPSKPRRSVMFIGFDLEEVGLFGSRYFVEHSPVPLDKVVLFITADMIGRSLGGVCGDRVFVMGSENAPALRPWIEAAGKDLPLTTGLLGTDLLLINRSDYGPFRARKVPYLFFSTGENPTYHRSTDVPETIDYPKVEAVSRMIHRIARSAATEESAPTWVAGSPPILNEAETIQGVFQTLMEHQETLKIGGAQMLLMRNTSRSLDGIVKRGEITPDERATVIRVARLILFSVF
ncbi:MAG: M28 family metallopeptidase, partial [Isosphaeraceae bacterium]